MSDIPKPPYVTFETRALEDRNASIEAGHFVAKDVHFALITPAGTKDRIEKIATEWLHDLKEAVQQERFPAEWLDAYNRRYKSWLESREIPEDGSPVVDWPAVSPAQVKMLLDLNIRTVEQLAEATEEALAHMGMGARALKAKAQAWLDSSRGDGKVSAELEQLRQANADLIARDAEREAQFKAMQTRLLSLEKAPK